MLSRMRRKDLLPLAFIEIFQNGAFHETIYKKLLILSCENQEEL